MNKVNVDFNSLRFGYASAENERVNDPELLLKGYYDYRGLVEEALNGDRYLFLGYKGSGKSAIGQKLSVEYADDPMVFVDNLQLKDFPFRAFDKVGVSNLEPESRYPTSWAWLLLLRLVASFQKDQGGNQTPNFKSMVSALKEQGILPEVEFKKVVIKSSKTKFKAALPSMLEFAKETDTTDAGLAFQLLVDQLRAICNEFRSDSRHIIVIDGLDDILTNGDIQFRSLASLVQEVVTINQALVLNGVSAKIVVLCRTDIFELFPDANKNKVRSDSAVSLDWYQDTRSPEETALVKLADLRVQLTSGNPDASILDLFPKSIKGENTLASLLLLTRHTPRDFLQLLENIRQFSEKGKPLTEAQILNGMRKYSIEYFLPEIKDELVGILTPEQIDAVFSLISAMRKRDFSYRDLTEMLEMHGNSKLDKGALDDALGAFYDRSAIGTVHGARGYDAYTFKFRNRNSSLGFPGRLMLHKGLWKAMNIS